MIDEKLMRRISDALTVPGGMDADTELRGILERNPEAAEYARELGVLDGWMRDWSMPELDGEAAEAMAQGIEGRLEESAKYFGDFSQPPRFDDPYANPPPAAEEFSVGNLGALEVQASVPAPPKRSSLPPLPQPTGERAAMPDIAPVPLQAQFSIPSTPPPASAETDEASGEKRGAVWWPMALAAAAVLVVGVGGWMAMGDSQGAASMTAAPSSEARPGAAASPGDMQAARVAAERAKLEAEVARIRAEEEAAEEERTQKLAEQQKAAEASAESADEDSASGGASASRRSSRRTGTASKSLSGGSSAQPDTPSKSDVLSAMKGVEPRVMACRKGRHGVLTVKMTVSGSTGRVTGTSVTGSFVGSPEGDCAMRAVRSASFPKFRKNSFSIAYPFRF